MREPAPATAAEITSILGPIDEFVLAEIMRTGASAEEVQEAFVRLEADDAVGAEAQRSTAARVREVMAILEAQDIRPDEQQ